MADVSRRRRESLATASPLDGARDSSAVRPPEIVAGGPIPIAGHPLDRMSSPAMDAVRYLIASLQHADEAALLPTRLGFTSALAGEGVTFISEMVGAVLAHDSQERVCVVDVNWSSPDSGPSGEKRSRRRRRRRRRSSDVSVQRPGVAEAMRKEVALRDIVMETSDPRLTLVAAGAATESEGQVFARSDRLALIIRALERHHDRLILGLPPVLVSSAALPLARHTSAVALVVRQGVTTEAQVRAMVDRLGPIPVAGVVLNRSTSAIPRPLLRRLSNW
jgi:Mrp family chromosome partitioning ATPase